MEADTYLTYIEQHTTLIRDERDRLFSKIDTIVPQNIIEDTKEIDYELLYRLNAEYLEFVNSPVNCFSCF